MDCPGCEKGEDLGLKVTGGRGMVDWGMGVVSMGESVCRVWSFSKVPSMEDSFPLTDVMDSSMWSNLSLLFECCSDAL